VTTSFNCDPTPVHLGQRHRSGPDTAAELQCQSGSCQIHIPDEWTTRRLTTISTQVLDAGTGKYQPVDSYALAQQFPRHRRRGADPVEHRPHRIRLDRRESGGRTPVTFEGQLYDNRIPGYNNLPGLAHWRMYNIATQTGETISITYSTPAMHAGEPAADHRHHRPSSRRSRRRTR